MIAGFIEQIDFSSNSLSVEEAEVPTSGECERCHVAEAPHQPQHTPEIVALCTFPIEEEAVHAQAARGRPLVAGRIAARAAVQMPACCRSSR